MTLFNSKRIIKHYLEILTFAIFKKVEIFLKNLKMVKNQQNFSKKVFLSLKYLIILNLKVKNQIKSVIFFSDFSHGITHIQKNTENFIFLKHHPNTSPTAQKPFVSLQVKSTHTHTNLQKILRELQKAPKKTYHWLSGYQVVFSCPEQL